MEKGVSRLGTSEFYFCSFCLIFCFVCVFCRQHASVAPVESSVSFMDGQCGATSAVM